jgi:hypothetical protein
VLVPVLVAKVYEVLKVSVPDTRATTTEDTRLRLKLRTGVSTASTAVVGELAETAMPLGSSRW